MRFALAGIALFVASTAAPALQGGSPGLDALKELSILELSEIEVTSVSRTAESLGSAAAAIAVVTQENIRRSGATTVPEALRGVPGIHVARRNSNSWAVASRGFSSINTEKLLVLSDTRSIYTPLHAGVQWDVQDYLMEDIERIEVIRGPGATQWGSNAVNGVINITTRNARDTQGFYAKAGTGSEERAALAARVGGKVGGSGYYRIFGQYIDRDSSELADMSSPDDWRMGHLGFRSDWEGGNANTFTLQGDWYDGRIGQIGPGVTIIGLPGPPPPLRVQVNGGNVLGRWRHALDSGSTMELRAYYDHTHRNDPTYRDKLDTIDLDFQHQFALPAQQIIWGLNYRWMSNRNVGKGVFAVDPPLARDEVFSGFLQDQIALRDWLHLTLGTKLEENDFSGFEVQPSARLSWALPRGQTLWAAVSRAVRVPTRLERDVAIEVTPPGADPGALLLGSSDFNAERLLAWELGYRWQVSPRLSLDLASFLNRYRGLASLEFGTPFIDPDDGRTMFPIVNRNLSDGRAVGGEALVTFSPAANWRLTGSYSYLDLNIDTGGDDLNRGRFADGATPRHQVGLRSAVDVAGFQVDGFLRYLSAIRRESQITTGEGIDGYTELDLTVAYPWKQFQFALGLHNLLHHSHLEFGPPAQRGGIERSIFFSVAWRSP
jgi:iron complex outermembrane receptor protein